MKSVNRISKAFGYSFDGLASAFRSEPAFRQEIVIFAIGLVAAILLPAGLVAKALLVSSLILILLMELANTAIEAVVDRISDARHPLSKKAKDIGSALVFLAFINAIIIWGAVIFSYVV